MTPSPLSHPIPAARTSGSPPMLQPTWPATQRCKVVAELLTRLREMSFRGGLRRQLAQRYPFGRSHAVVPRARGLEAAHHDQLTRLATRRAETRTAEFQPSSSTRSSTEATFCGRLRDRGSSPGIWRVWPTADFFDCSRSACRGTTTATPHQDLVGWFIGALLATRTRSTGLRGSRSSPR